MISDQSLDHIDMYMRVYIYIICVYIYALTYVHTSYIYIYICMCIYIYRKKSTGRPGGPDHVVKRSPPQNAFPARVWATFRLGSACQIAVPSQEHLSRQGLGHFSAQIRLPDRFPARVWATFRPDRFQDRPLGPQDRQLRP